MSDPDELTVDALREAISRVLTCPRKKLRKRIDATLDFSGADKAAVEIIQVANGLVELLVQFGDMAVT